jgi:hypothetical protein
LPVIVASVGMIIAAAAVSSPKLMYIGAAISGLGLGSIFVGRYILNEPDPVRIEPAIVESPKREHAVAHR